MVEYGSCGFHMMAIDKINDIVMVEDSFSCPRPGYKKGDKGMSTIFCEL